MIDNSTILAVNEAVHKPLNYNDYDQTAVREGTNCYSHAIGSTVHSDNRVYRLGAASGKNLDDYYTSIQEVNELLLSDLKIFELEIEKLELDKKDLIGSEMSIIEPDQLIIALFAQQRRENDVIKEFHFIRYDSVKGWTEKRWGFKPFEVNAKINWYDFWPYKQVGIYRITR